MDERLHRIRIESTKAGSFHVEIDGKPLYGVTKVAIELGADKWPRVKLEISPRSIETNELPFFASTAGPVFGEGG